MGMKPEGVACEFHLPVPFEHYPQKLSELDLDLALVPLEQNLFNECKSNLRLLELGSCGFPIICTDIEPYRCGLPVHRVKIPLMRGLLQFVNTFTTGTRLRRLVKNCAKQCIATGC